MPPTTSPSECRILASPRARFGNGPSDEAWAVDTKPLILLQLTVLRIPRVLLPMAVLVVLAQSATADIPVVSLNGLVDAISAAHVVTAIERADLAHAPLVVIQIDTPGGLDTSMRQIVDAMLNSRTPVA